MDPGSQKRNQCFAIFTMLRHDQFLGLLKNFFLVPLWILPERTSGFKSQLASAASFVANVSLNVG